MASSSGGIRAGRAFVEAGLNDNPLRAGLKRAEALVKGFGRSVEGVGSRLKGAGAAASGLGANLAGIGAAASAPFAAAVLKAASFNETLSKTGVIFGDSAKLITDQADALAEKFGVSKKEFVDAAASFGSVFKGLGKGQGEAAALGNTLAKLGLDLASFNDTSNADAFTALQAALRGELDPLERFNVFLSAAKIENEALALGLARTKGELTDSAKKQATLSLITKQSADASGDLSRTSGSLGNQMKALKGRVENAAIAVGSALVPAVTDAATWINDAAGKAAKWIGENQGLVRTAAAVAAGVVVAGAAFVGLGAVLGGIGTVLGTVGAGLSLVAGAIGLVASPLGVVGAALAGGAYLWANYTEGGRGAMASLAEGFAGLKDDAITSFGAITNALKSGNFAAAGQVALAGIEVAWLKGTLFLRKVWDDWGLGLVDGFSSISAMIAKVWTNMTFDLRSTWGKAIRGILDLVAPIAGVLGRVLGVDVAGGIDKVLGKLGVEQDSGAVEEERRAALDSIDQGHQAGVDARRDASRAGIGRNAAALEAAQDRFRTAVDEANRPGDPDSEAKDKAKANLAPAALSAGLGRARANVESRGTFSASAIAGLGTGASLAQRALDEAKETTKELKELNRKTDRMRAELAATNKVT